jgi:hypothetical protein
MTVSTNPRPDQEARWPAVFALFAIVGLRVALPRSLAASPAWVPLLAVTMLVIPTILARQMRRYQLNRWLGFVITGIVTLDMVWSLALLVASLPAHRLAPTVLLRSSAVLWISNILIFASWYWRLDAGGPNARDRRAVHGEGSFLFPQMTLDASDPDSPAPWMVARVCRLSFSRVQCQHRLLADRRSGALALGQAADDASVLYLAGYTRIAGCSRREYSLNNSSDRRLLRVAVIF